jgi:aryl-alcohol dehydrogenase-like predicted oxidoreductase
MIYQKLGSSDLIVSKIGLGCNSEVDGSKEYVKKAIENSLKRLDIDYVDIYYLHRVDPKVPKELNL